MTINWDDASARLALIERVGHEEYNRLIRAHIDARGPIHTVSTRFGTLHAVSGTDKAFSTRKQAEEYLAAEATRIHAENLARVQTPEYRQREREVEQAQQAQRRQGGRD